MNNYKISARATSLFVCLLVTTSCGYKTSEDYQYRRSVKVFEAINHTNQSLVLSVWDLPRTYSDAERSVQEYLLSRGLFHGENQSSFHLANRTQSSLEGAVMLAMADLTKFIAQTVNKEEGAKSEIINSFAGNSLHGIGIMSEAMFSIVSGKEMYRNEVNIYIPGKKWSYEYTEEEGIPKEVIGGDDFSELVNVLSKNKNFNMHLVHHPSANQFSNYYL